MKKKIIASAFLFAVGLGSAWANDRSYSTLATFGKVHNILSDKLPATLLANIKKDYKDYWITELYKEGGEKEPSYFITVENADQVIKMSSTDSENWVVTDTMVKVN
jgi:hypothetical protein